MFLREGVKLLEEEQGDGDVPIELVLLMDEAGQWDGVPVELLLSRDTTRGFHHHLCNTLEKKLADPE